MFISADDLASALTDFVRRSVAEKYPGVPVVLTVHDGDTKAMCWVRDNQFETALWAADLLSTSTPCDAVVITVQVLMFDGSPEEFDEFCDKSEEPLSELKERRPDLVVNAYNAIMVDRLGNITVAAVPFKVIDGEIELGEVVSFEGGPDEDYEGNIADVLREIMAKPPIDPDHNVELRTYLDNQVPGWDEKIDDIKGMVVTEAIRALRERGCEVAYGATPAETEMLQKAFSLVKVDRP